ncbi:MAG: T9SS type A sorting domain-containing protein [Bacteroidota bacterium]
MYSKSENQGNTWTTPIAIANDSLQWFGLPDIACDLQNHLYVSFEGDDMAPANTLIYMVQYNGTAWSNHFVVSDNMYGSNNSLVVVDKANRLYCFWHSWYNNEVKLTYKYLENNSWSQAIIPYTQDGEFFWIKKVVADSSNNLHCVGTHHYQNESRYNDRVIYCFFYRNTNQWAPIENISDTTNRSWQGNSIDIDENAIPHIAWGEFINAYPSLDNASLYRYPNESGWLPIDSVEINHNSYYHQLVIDNNNLCNISVRQYIDLPNNVHLSYLINYREINNSWIGEIIDSVNGVFFEPNLIKSGNSDIGIIYYKGSVSSDSASDVYFSKYNIFTKIKLNELPATELLITPNPFNDKTEISYIINSQCHLVLDIFDLNGKLIERLTDQTQSPGKYCRTWQCTGLNRKEVKAGVYMVRLQAGRYVYSRKVVKL